MTALLKLRAVGPVVRTCAVLLFLGFFLSACSVPTLESTECTEATPAVRELYSFHFGNDQKFAPEDLALREKYLTPEFAGRIRNAPPATDPFTLTDDTPKAFKLGGCTTVEPEKKVNFDVLLLWKTDERSEQRKLKVEAVKQNDKWLVNGVTAE
jgi:hypothetical protein